MNTWDGWEMLRVTYWDKLATVHAMLADGVCECAPELVEARREVMTARHTMNKYARRLEYPHLVTLEG